MARNFLYISLTTVEPVGFKVISGGEVNSIRIYWEHVYLHIAVGTKIVVCYLVFITFSVFVVVSDSNSPISHTEVLSDLMG